MLNNLHVFDEFRLYIFLFQASSKGVSSTITGWIFGIFALVQFVTSPIFGKFVSQYIIFKNKTYQSK